VIEFNARFGDPETQPLLAMLDSSLATLLLAAATGKLADVDAPTWKEGAAVAVVVAAENYPGAPATGDVIHGIDAAEAIDGVDVIHAGTARNDAGELVTSGGRVLAVTATGPDLAAARRRAYDATELISIRGSHHREDIALLAAAGHIQTPAL
jgi:phosphoribosylamine--glycine ligase